MPEEKPLAQRLIIDVFRWLSYAPKSKWKSLNLKPSLSSDFVYGVGTNADPVALLLKEYLKQFSYTTHEFRVSEHLRTLELGINYSPSSTFDEMNALMSAGNEARSRAKADDILAVMAVNDIAARRTMMNHSNVSPTSKGH